MIWHYDGTWQGYLAAVFRARTARDPGACFIAPEASLAWRNPRKPREEAGTAGSQGSLDFPGMTDTGPGRPAEPVHGRLANPDLDRQVLPVPDEAIRGMPEFPPGDDRVLALRVLAGLARLAGPEACLEARDAWLHRDPGIEGPLWQFILLCTRLGAGALKAEADPCVRTVLDRAQGVRRQAHKFMGILRFQELEGSSGLYAVMEPDHHILPLLAGHFLPRLGKQPWMIHDRLRSLGVLHREGILEALEDLRLDLDLPVSLREKDFQNLWKGFFKAVSIPGKENPALQRAHLPKKFWSCLTEVPGTGLQEASAGPPGG